MSKPFTTIIVFASILIATSGITETKAKSESPKAQEKKTVDAAAVVKSSIEDYSISGTVDEAFGQVEKLGKVVVYVDWDGLTEAGVGKTKRVSVAGKNHTLRQIITRLVVKSANRGKPLGWLIHENVIIVTSQPRAIKLRQRLRDIGTDPVATRQTQKTENTVAGQTYKFDFDGQPLCDVIDYFREITKANIHVNWNALEQSGVDKTQPVTLRAEGISVSKAMDLVLSGINSNKGRMDSIYWVIDDGVVEISTGDVLNREMRTRVFDVSDLLHVVPDSEAQRVKLSTIGEKSNDSGTGFGDMFEDEDKGEKKESLAEQREKLNVALIEIVKNSIGEDMWKPIGQGSISIYKKQLVVTQSLLGFKLMGKSLR